MNTFGQITVRECVNIVPPTDSRCQDPAFAIANPTICPAIPRLIVKPGAALTCTLGSVQFSAFLVTAGVEQDVSADCVWKTSSPTIALIGAASGNATGLTAGEATISATYEGYTATSDLTVMESSRTCCEDQHVAMMLVVDTSRSMSQSFSESYGTRLDFAKAAAGQFASEVNEMKDTVGLITFNDSGYLDAAGLTDDKTSVADAVAAIAQTQQKTSFYNALHEAITLLDDSGSDLRVIVLFSDGEDTSADASSGYGDDDNPITLLANFKESGGIVVCLGCRSSGVGFAFLSALSTGGFFVNGYSGTETDTLDYLSGLKGYICAGNCTPTGDEMVAEGALDYSAFDHWTVSDGSVDLIGNAFLDLLPGNGLYVDLRGVGGRMVSRVPFSLTAGHQYRLTLTLAGNQREAGTPYSAKAQVFYLTGATENAMLSQVILINDYTQPFTPYAFTFTALASVDAYISIQAQDMPPGNNANFGLLLGQVNFDDVTDLVSLLIDNFDTENLTYVPPACGQASLYVNNQYAVGYNCYGDGCLSEPPPAQAPDPNPLANIEAGGYTPPKVYTSTKTACVSCPPGTLNRDSTEYVTVDELSTTLAAAAILEGYILQAHIPTASLGFINTLQQYALTVQGSNDGITWTTLNVTQGFMLGIGDIGQSTHGNPGIPQNTTAYSRYRLTTSPSFPAATIIDSWLLQFATAQQVCASGTGTGATQAAADAAATAAAVAAATALLNCEGAWTSSQTVTIKCPTGTCGNDATVTSSATSFVSQEDADTKALAAATAAAQAIIDADCTDSTNESQITLPAVAWLQSYYGEAIPFYTGKHVTDVGPVANVTVTLRDIAASANSNSFVVLLRSPSGTWVVVWSDQFNPVFGASWADGITISFDDSGVPMPWAPLTLTDGETYACANGGLAPALAMPPGTPAAGSADYNFSLSAFVGEERYGTWSLWVAVRLSSATAIRGGWDLVIT